MSMRIPTKKCFVCKNKCFGYKCNKCHRKRTHSTVSQLRRERKKYSELTAMPIK